MASFSPFPVPITNNSDFDNLYRNSKVDRTVETDLVSGNQTCENVMEGYYDNFENCDHFLPNSGTSNRDTCRAVFGVCSDVPEFSQTFLDTIGQGSRGRTDVCGLEELRQMCLEKKIGLQELF